MPERSDYGYAISNVVATIIIINRSVLWIFQKVWYRSRATSHLFGEGGFARGLIIAEGGVTPVLLVSVHPWLCFVIFMSETGATPFFG